MNLLNMVLQQLLYWLERVSADGHSCRSFKVGKSIHRCQNCFYQAVNMLLNAKVGHFNTEFMGADFLFLIFILKSPLKEL